MTYMTTYSVVIEVDSTNIGSAKRIAEDTIDKLVNNSNVKISKKISNIFYDYELTSRVTRENDSVTISGAY